MSAAPLPFPTPRRSGAETTFPIRLFEGLDLAPHDEEGAILRGPGSTPGPQFTLAELVEQEGMAYAAWGSNLGRLLSETMAELARKIRQTGATTVDEYEARAELLEQWAAEEAAQPDLLPPDWDEPYIP
jgi:hypothetical protein